MALKPDDGRRTMQFIALIVLLWILVIIALLLSPKLRDAADPAEMGLVYIL